MVFLNPLTNEEEKKLLDLYFEGNEKERKTAKDKLIEHNLRLVAHIAKKFRDNQQIEQEDLLSIGTIGLVKAVNTFKPNKNIKVSTYASKCIENEILMYIRTSKKSKFDISLNDYQSEDVHGKTVSLLDKLIDETADVSKIVINNDSIEMIFKRMDECLNETEKYVIINRYGIGCISKTQNEISEELDISRSYVSRIEKKSLEKLKKIIE